MQQLTDITTKSKHFLNVSGNFQIFVIQGKDGHHRLRSNGQVEILTETSDYITIYTRYPLAQLGENYEQ